MELLLWASGKRLQRQNLLFYLKLLSILDFIQVEGTTWIFFVIIGRRPWLVISLDIFQLFMTIFFEFLLYFVFIGFCKLLVGLGADDFPLSFSCILYL